MKTENKVIEPLVERPFGRPAYAWQLGRRIRSIKRPNDGLPVRPFRDVSQRREMAGIPCSRTGTTGIEGGAI